MFRGCGYAAFLDQTAQQHALLKWHAGTVSLDSEFKDINLVTHILVDGLGRKRGHVIRQTDFSNFV